MAKEDTSRTKVGVYVDVANLARNGGYGMRFDVLREFVCRGGAEPVRLNAYVAFDAERAESDTTYRYKQHGFHAILRDYGFKVIEKRVKWYVDDEGNRFGKANADLDLAVDALLQSAGLDRVLLATGDGDFVRVVLALQNRGCRVEALAFKSVSTELRREVDLFVSGYLVPNLLPASIDPNGPAWGEIGSRVRGICYHYGKGFGFLRYMHRIRPEMWKTDSRDAGSPYQSIFFHGSQLPSGVNDRDLPSRDLIFEFGIAENPDRTKGEIHAVNLKLVYPEREPR